MSDGHPTREPSFLVRGILLAARAVRAVSPYRMVLHLNKRPTAGEWYVLTWIAILVLCLMGARTSTVGGVAFGVACFRYVDLTLYQGAILLDRSERLLASYPRTLVLTALNLVELTLMVAVTARWWMHTPAGAAIYDGFNVVLARSTVLDSDAFMKVATALVIISALVLLAGMLGMIVGVIGQSFRESAGEGESQGNA